MAQKKSSKAWARTHIDDPYVRLAQQHNYRSRAAFKLIGLDEKHQLIRLGMSVVDLGAAPGAWAQVLQRRLTKPGSRSLTGRVIALDRLPMEPVEGVHFVQGDFLEDQTHDQLAQLLQQGQIDLIISDMAPNLSGIAVSDAARMADLVEIALEFSETYLKQGGSFLAKCFQGSGYSQLVELFKQTFKKVSACKPAASRSRSSEIYLLGREKK